MYACMLVGKLLPMYDVVVQAFNVSKEFHDPDKIDWSKINTMLNAHERSVQRKENEEAVESGITMSVHRQQRSTSRTYSQKFKDQRDLSEVQCYNCKEMGHYSNKCTNQKKKVVTFTPQSNNRREEQVSAAMRSNRFEILSDDEEVEARSYSAVVSKSNDEMESVMGASQIPSRKRLVKLSDTQKGEVKSEANPASNAPASMEVRTKKSSKANTPVQSTKKKVPEVERNNAKEGRKFKSNEDDDLSIALGSDGLSWGIDSMASVHISGSKKSFIELHKCAPMTVQMADGGTVTTTQCGDVSLYMPQSNNTAVRRTIKNVYYHERFAANLLSLNTLRLDGWGFSSTSEETVITTPSGKEVKLSSKQRVTVMHCMQPEERVNAVQSVPTRGTKRLILMHERLNHMGYDGMVRLIKGGKLTGLDKNITERDLKEARQYVLECTACAQGKGHRTAFGHRGLDKGTEKGETLHMDTYQVRMEDGNKSWLEYGLTVMDPYSQWRWFDRLRTKDEAAERVIGVINNARTQLGCKVRRLYTDGGTEFINRTLKEFCTKEGIELHYPPARTQQLNGVAERSVRTSKDAARTMMIHAGIPMRFWTRAAIHATYVWNRSATSSETGTTPFETMYNRKPSAQHWGVFGCDAFTHLPKEQRSSALGLRMDPCIYLGHDPIQNCAVVWMLEKKKMLRSRDIQFRENKFEHAAALKAGENEVQNVIENDQPEQIIDVENENEENDELSQEIREEREWEVERFMKERTNNGKIEYLVKWVGYEEPSWEPEENCEHAVELMDEYRQSIEQQNIQKDSQEEKEEEEEEEKDQSNVRRSPRDHASTRSSQAQVNMIVHRVFMTKSSSARKGTPANSYEKRYRKAGGNKKGEKGKEEVPLGKGKGHVKHRKGIRGPHKERRYMRCQASPCETDLQSRFMKGHDCSGKLDREEGDPPQTRAQTLENEQCTQIAWSHANSSHGQRCKDCAIVNAKMLATFLGKREAAYEEHLDQGSASDADVWNHDASGFASPEKGR